MQINELENKKILILGLGREGLVTAKFLRKHYPGIKLGMADARDILAFDLETQKLLEDSSKYTLHLGKDYLSVLNDYQVVIKTPGLSPYLKEIKEAQQAGVVLTSATRLFFANRVGKIIAITGSKGKSTTSSLIYQVLKAGGKDVELVGNIGKSALEYLDQDGPNKLFVFEISSYQLMDLEESPDVAVLVSFFPDHLDYHGSLDEYFRCKMNLVNHLKAGAKVVYNVGSERINQFVGDRLGKRTDIELIGFNDGLGSRVEGAAAWVGGEKLVDLSEVKLIGEHNLQNMLAAEAVGKIFEIDRTVIVSALKEFKGLEHRLEFVGKYRGINFYNDAISTTPESTIAGIEALKASGIGTLFVGGMDRGYQFKKLAEKILEVGIKNIIIFPDTGAQIWHEIEQCATDQKLNLPKHFEVNKMDEAVKIAYEETEKGTICLLSNASPSFNLFKNYEDKGRQFKENVVRIGSIV